jgi:choline kinase
VTLLDRTVKVLREAGVTRIVVVAGYRSEDVAATIHSHGLPVELVVNPHWQQGTSTSVLAGLEQVDEDRCLIVMGDHVFEADDVRRLMAAPGRNVLAVDRDPQRQVGGLGGVPPVRVRTADDADWSTWPTSWPRPPTHRRSRGPPCGGGCSTTASR